MESGSNSSRIRHTSNGLYHVGPFMTNHCCLKDMSDGDRVFRKCEEPNRLLRTLVRQLHSRQRNPERTTKRYEELIKGYGVDEWGAKDFDSKEFMKGLASIQNLPMFLGCLKGGGNDECKIRPCASKKKISECSECNESATCKNARAILDLVTCASHYGQESP